MNSRICSLLFFIVMCPIGLVSQNKYDLPQFFKESGMLFTQPLRWDGNDWLNLGLLSTATACAMIIEPRPSDVPFIQSPFYYSAPVVAGRMYGELYSPAVFFAGYASYSLITGDTVSRKIAYEIGQACIYGGIVVYALKISVGRSRPYTNEGKQTYHPFSGLFDDAHHSFPSGHVVVAMTISTILSMNAGPLWLKILAYVPAAFTPASRMYQGFHWASDCVMGAGIGYFIGKYCVDTHERNNEKKHDDKSSLQLEGIYPLAFSYRF